MSAPQRRAAVAGGSIGGLLVGNMLARTGWLVDVCERAESLEARGAGIAGHDELTAVLQAVGLSAGRPAAIDVTGRVAIDRHGRELARYDYPQYLTSWNLIFSLLRERFPPERYHAGTEVLDMMQDGAGVRVRLSSGEVAEADLLVGADGIRSRVRGLLAPAVEPVYGGYVAWRGIVDEADLSPGFRAGTFGRYSFCFPPGGQFIGYPLAGSDGSVEPGRRRYNFLWYRHVPAGPALDDLLTDAHGVRHEHAIPPPLIRPEHLDALRRAGERDLPPSFAEVVSGSSQYLLQPIYDVESQRIAFGRVALVGDAAFVCRPHVGIGVLKAAQDAAALAECLQATADVPVALARYEARRLEPGREAVAFGRHLGSFIERGLPAPTSDPRLQLDHPYIIRESARLPRVRPPSAREPMRVPA